MLDGSSAPLHPILAFWLDVADKAIKAAAVALGAIWTYWNFRKSRTYEQKMELQLICSIFERRGSYLEVLAKLKNLGATKHSVQQTGTYCEFTAILRDLSEQTIDVRSVFTKDDYIEPGETISDRIFLELRLDPARVIWLRVNLRVTSGSVQWQQSEIIRIQENSGAGEAKP